MQNFNSLTIYHRELRVVVEFVIDEEGAVKLPSRVKTQLNQLGIYELDLWESFFEQHLLSLQQLFSTENEFEDSYDDDFNEDTDLNDAEFNFFNFDTFKDHSSCLLINNNFNNLENLVPAVFLQEDVSPSNDEDNYHDDNIYQASNNEILIDEDDTSLNELGSQEFSVYVTIVIFFFKRKGKTIVYFTNPFVAPDLTKLIWLNTFDFYSLVQDKFEYYRLFPYYKKISLGPRVLSDYKNYTVFATLKKFWSDKVSLKNSFFNSRKFKFRQLSNKTLIKWYKRKIFLKHVMRTRKTKRIYHFMYLLKSRKWISFDALFKLMVWKAIFLKIFFSLSDLKIYLYSLFSLTIFYKGFLKKRYKKRKRFKELLKRNIYGQII